MPHATRHVATIWLRLLKVLFADRPDIECRLRMAGDAAILRIEHYDAAGRVDFFSVLKFFPDTLPNVESFLVLLFRSLPKS